MPVMTPFLRWTWGAALSCFFAWSWLILWGLIPGTPAADEVAVDDSMRFSLHRPASSPLGLLNSGFDQITRETLSQTDSIVVSQYSDPELLSHLKNVRRMRITRTGIRSDRLISLQTLAHLRDLEALTCSGTGYGTFRHLPAMPHLVDFSARDTTLRDVRGIDQQRALQNLDLGLSRNHVMWTPRQSAVVYPEVLDLSGIENLKQLQSLNLTGRALRDLGTLVQLPRLKHLVLSYNRLTSISGVDQLTALERLELDHNHIQDLSPLLALPNLKSVSLLNNPQTEANIAVFHALRDRGVTILDAPRPGGSTS